jgi:hypothetical protein
LDIVVMAMKVSSLLTQEINWDRVEEPEFPFSTRHNGKEMCIRLNDFPAEPLYTLISDGSEIVSFDDWPESWTRKPKAEKFKVAGSSSGSSISKSYSKAAPKKRAAKRAVAKNRRPAKASVGRSK